MPQPWSIQATSEARYRASAWLPLGSLTAVAASVLLLNGGPLVIGAALLGCASLALVRRPDRTTLLVIFVLYTNAAGVAVKFHGVPLVLAAAFPLVLMWPLAVALLVHREPVLMPRAFWLTFGFVVIQFLSMACSDYPEHALPVVVTSIGEGLVLFFLVINTVRTREMLGQVVWVLLLAGALMGGLGSYQFLSGTYDNDYFGFAQVGFDVAFGAHSGLDAQPRLAGPIGVENRYAHLMLMLIPLGWCQCMGAEQRWSRLAAGLATLLITVGVGLTYSRGAAVGLFAILLALIWLRQLRWRWIVLGGLAVVIAFGVFPEYRARVASIADGLTAWSSKAASGSRDSAIEGRVNEAITAGLIFARNPILGAGPGMYAVHYERLKHLAGRGQHSGKRRAHNLYLGVAAEQGVLGLGCFLAMLAVSIRPLFSASTRVTAGVNLPLAFLLVLIAYMTTGLFADLSYVRYFWLMLALANVAALTAESKPAGILRPDDPTGE